MPDEPRQPQDKYVVRLPDGMRDSLRYAAETSGRSMNSEIVERLEQSMILDLPILPPDLVARIEAAGGEQRAAAERTIALNILDILNEYFPAPPRQLSVDEFISRTLDLISRLSGAEQVIAQERLLQHLDPPSTKARGQARTKRAPSKR